LKRIAVRAFGLLLASLAASGCARAAAQPAGPTLPNPPTFTYPAVPTRPVGDSERMLVVAGLERTYLLHVPPGVNPRSPVPLVLVFHGHRMDAEYLLAMSRFNDVADAAGFLVAYPNGTGPSEALSFNAGLCCGSAAENNVDEAAFARRILADLEGTLAVDPARIYITGFSNGAILAYRLACEMSDTFAAFAPVDGNLMFGPCQPRQKVSLIHIQGLSDSSAPYSDEDLDPDTDPNILSVEGSVAFWASVDGCSGFPAVEQEGIVTRTVYSSCARGIAVELISLKGIGHTWPPDSVFPASRTIWDFFAAHPKP
jgi:polyhydroxybutyrate depolymerase